GALSPTTPFLGIDYRILKEHEFILKGNIARNYHLPTLNDLYWKPGGNPDLKPENGFSTEIGLQYVKVWDRLYLFSEVTGYYSDINNWIVWVPNNKGYWEPENVKTVISKGIEVKLKLQGKINKIEYSIFSNYAYTSAKNYGDSYKWGDASYGKQLVYTPLHSGNLMLNLNYKRYFFTYQHNAYGERFTTSSNDITLRRRLVPYFMNNLMMGYNWHIKKVNISTEVKVYNLFDENYRSALYHPMPGRNYMLLLTFKL
ncbi:MAG: TonB-dependent receptor, partial [Bacteroidales bacterium]|nr:TonB-dependent receptor [Bacteroidales bacterium]